MSEINCSGFSDTAKNRMLLSKQTHLVSGYIDIDMFNTLLCACVQYTP